MTNHKKERQKLHAAVRADAEAEENKMTKDVSVDSNGTDGNSANSSASTAAPRPNGTGGGVSRLAQQTTPPNIDEILSREFVISSPSRYRFVFSSEGPPRAEIHLTTTATVYLPDSRLSCRLPEDVIPDLVRARTETLRREEEEARAKPDTKPVSLREEAAHTY